MMTNLSSSLKIEIESDSSLWEAFPSAPEKVTQAVLSCLKKIAPTLKEAEVSVLLTDDEEIRHFNKTYRHKDKATNVLSFPQQEPFFFKALPGKTPLLLGDILIAYETVVQEAETQEKSLEDHLTHLVVHATLHLLGYDHETEEEALIMESLEIQVLESLSISNPYERIYSYA